MKDKIERALLDMYIRKTSGVELHLRGDGLYESKTWDTCSKCEGRAFSSHSGAHNKTVEHVAEIHGVSVKALRIALGCTQIIPKDSNDSYGYKCLMATETEQGYRVTSPSQSETVWNPYEVLHAECEGGWCNEDNPLSLNCGCGIYGFWAPYSAYMYTGSLCRIVAKIEIGGVVVVADDGFRAEYAKIVSIVGYGLERERPVAEMFGVPVEMAALMFDYATDLDRNEVVWVTGYEAFERRIS